MMKFSATVTLQYETPFSAFGTDKWKEGLDWMRNIGLDGAELCISNYDGIDVPAIKEELDKRNLGCSTLSTGQARGMEGLSFIGVSEDLVKKTQQRFIEHINAAACFGSKVTVGLMRGIGSEQTREQDLDAFREAFLPVVDYADSKGVMIILEAINRYETALLNSAEAVCDFIENRLGNPSCVGVLWDLFHSNIEDRSFDRAIERLGRHLGHIHLADSNRMFPGYGHTDLDAILMAVKQSGYQEYASFECFNLPSREIVLQQTGPFVDHIRSL
ncbi:MAG: sugar phosphate isomerase/epimerase [Lachnospiraceae bacterium]|nr:sugar phosphate isomerase/epimerase [Lachnospiraceae bacterium]